MQLVYIFELIIDSPVTVKYENPGSQPTDIAHTSRAIRKHHSGSVTNTPESLMNGP